MDVGAAAGTDDGDGDGGGGGGGGGGDDDLSGVYECWSNFALSCTVCFILASFLLWGPPPAVGASFCGEIAAAMAGTRVALSTPAPAVEE